MPVSSLSHPRNGGEKGPSGRLHALRAELNGLVGENSATTHRTSNVLDRAMRSMSRYYEDRRHLHRSKEVGEQHCRAWVERFPARAAANASAPVGRPAVEKAAVDP
jgi:hypothetical protein